MPEVQHALIDFLSLLLFPFLGLLGLLRRRAIGWLVAAVIAWLVIGGAALAYHWNLGLDERRLQRAWLVGLALGAAFLAVTWLKDQRKVSRWLKLTMAAITLAVFVRALVDFFRLHG